MPAAPKSVFESIVEWSKGRPLWQRDALRRIIVQGKLAPADVAELHQLCLKGQGADGVTLTAVPLEESHVPMASAANAAISLTSITSVDGVNRLAAGQTLAFHPTGMTIIYGDNGAGKSGYVRILKKACRARSVAEILTDAFEQTSATVPSATIAYNAGGVPAAPVRWRNDAAAHPVLSAVTVFDRESGAVHVRNENEVFFRPFGLDVPDKLVEACKAVKELLTNQQNSLKSAQDPVFVTPTFNVNSLVGKILTSLKPKTNLGPLEAMATLSPAEEARLARLNEDLARDPLKVAAEQRARAESLLRFAAELSSALAIVSDEALSRFLRVATEAQQKRAAATLAAEAAFGTAAVRGVGESTWNALWEAARRYSEQVAYPGVPFPPPAGEAVCVLCHQDLPETAAARMSGFERFVKADTEKWAKEAEQAFEKARKALEAKPVRIAAFPLRREIAISNPDIAAAVLTFLANLRMRRWVCLRGLADPAGVELPALRANPVALVQGLAAQTEQYARELTAAADVAGRKVLEDERDALRDRKALQLLLPKAQAEIARLAQLDRVSKCITETAPRTITDFGMGLADEVITPRVRDRFQREIQDLAASRVRVDLVRSGGKLGAPQYQVRFFANKDAKVHAVLSEGEQTCVALAAFLTELATATHASCLVFDDPVSSLDHRWRRKVAERLVEESKVRQIIVFTHDLIFLNDLQTLSEAASLATKDVFLTKAGIGSGIVNDGLPWVGQKVKERLDNLEKEARAAKRLFEAHDEDGYDRAVANFYNRLRSTWERALEDVAFNNVVTRHRDYINAKGFSKVVALTSADTTAWAHGFKICCDITDAHDPSRGRNAPSPEPTKLLEHVGNLSTWVNDLRDRQKSIP